jgi:hypothetical protein
MRRLVDRERLLRFMRELGQRSGVAARIYLTGGSSAVLLEWRSATINVDVEIRPEADAVLQLLPLLKEEMQINVELASPGRFIPELPEWEERSQFIVREGEIDYFHYDFYAQVLSKIERSHTRDLEDVQAMLRRDLVEPRKLLEIYNAIERDLFRYPAVNPATFREAVERIIDPAPSDS